MGGSEYLLSQRQQVFSKGLQVEQTICPSPHWYIGGRDISKEKLNVLF